MTECNERRERFTEQAEHLWVSTAPSGTIGYRNKIDVRGEVRQKSNLHPPENCFDGKKFTQVKKIDLQQLKWTVSRYAAHSLVLSLFVSLEHRKRVLKKIIAFVNASLIETINVGYSNGFVLMGQKEWVLPVEYQSLNNWYCLQKAFFKCIVYVWRGFCEDNINRPGSVTRL